MHKYLLPLFMLILFATFSHAWWIPLEPVPDDVSTGGGITFGGGYVWCVIGNENSDFYAYDIVTGEWIEYLDDVPEEICDAGAITYETGYGRRIFVATFNQLFVYTKKYAWGEADEGEWNEEDPIYLPDVCGPGVSLTFQPGGTASPEFPITGWLYLLLGGGSRAFYRRGFEVLVEWPEGFYPPNDSQISQSNLVFDWSPGNENVTYQFQLDRTNFFASPIIDTLISVSEFQSPEGRLGNGTYYWRVRFNRNRRQFEWCEPMRFQLANSGRPRVNYRYPSNRAILVIAHPTLDWAPIGRTNRYRIQIAADSLFSMPVVDAETEMSEYRTDLANGEYWWRTSYILENNEWSSWSETNSFELQEGWEPLPEVPVEVDSGGALCFNRFYYPSHPAHNSESLYAFVGGRRRNFYYYAPGRNVWVEETGDPTPPAQRNGSSITAGGRVLLSVFGVFSRWDYVYFLEVDPGGRWLQGYDLPGPIGSGASITCDPVPIDAYLVVGGESDGFYFNGYPYDEEEIGGSQSQEVIPIAQKAMISYHHNWIVVRYSTDKSSDVRIQVYDLLGKRVKTLLSANVEKGEHQILWDMTDDSNREVSSGIYFITIDKENKPERLKITIR